MLVIKLFVMTFYVINFALAEQSPVFLWGSNSVATPSLITIPSSQFAKFLTPLLADKSLIVFLENGLTNKDFLCKNRHTDKSCFARLQGVSNKTFYASVENPVKALQTVGHKIEFNSVDNFGKIKNSLELSKGKIIFVNFNSKEPYSARDDTLQSHDKIIASITSSLKDNIFFMYTTAPFTSNDVSLRRQRRQTTAGRQSNAFRHGSDLLLYFTKLSIVSGSDVIALGVSEMDVKKYNATALSVTLTATSGSLLTFDVTLSGGYFFMKNLMYDTIKFRSSDVFSPTDFSYFCGNLTLHSVITENETKVYTLKWESLQFQAPFNYTRNDTFPFGDPWHCVGFFSGGILSGLLIVALLLTITFVGVCWMMDINTMDRFDDPKGKTITISASD